MGILVANLMGGLIEIASALSVNLAELKAATGFAATLGFILTQGLETLATSTILCGTVLSGTLGQLFAANDYAVRFRNSPIKVHRYRQARQLQVALVVVTSTFLMFNAIAAGHETSWVEATAFAWVWSQMTLLVVSSVLSLYIADIENGGSQW